MTSHDQPEGGRMTMYHVHADIGSGDLYVEADSADEALSKAIDQWLPNADRIIYDATFEVRPDND